MLIGALLAGAFTFFNIVPNVTGEEEELAREMAEYHARTGERVVLYMLACQPEGKPATAKIDRHVASYRKFAAACRRLDPELKVGILIQAVLGHFAGDAVVRDREDWQVGIDNKGQVYRWCPIDPRFTAYVKDFARRFAAEKPCFIMTDDDIRNIRGTCFCPLHAAELNRRTGLGRTPEEWRQAILASQPGSRDYEAYFKLQRESLVNLNRIVREAIDEVDPAIPASVCMGGEEYRFVTQHAEAIAAKGQRPAFRVANSLYLEHQRGRYPFAEVLTRTEMFVGMYEDWAGDLYDEADTWPQYLWSKSATSYHSHIVMAQLCGLKGAKIWYVNAHRAGGNRITRNYTDVMAAHKGYYGALATSLEGTHPVGVMTPAIFKPGEWHAAKPRVFGPEAPRPAHTWAETFFCRFGIPTMATKDFSRDGVWELAGPEGVSRLTDAELKALLSHKVIIDGKAAAAIAKRGFADLIGADVDEKAPAVNCELYEDTMKSAGRLVKNDAPPTYALKPGAKALTWLCFRADGGKPEKIAPGTVLYRNALGGTVALTSFGYYGIFYNLYGDERKAWLDRTLAALNGGSFDMIAKNNQDLAVLARETADGETAVVGVFNLNYDPLATLDLTLAKKPARVERLANDGTWRAHAVVWENGVLSVPAGIPCMGEGVYRITR